MSQVAQDAVVTPEPDLDSRWWWEALAEGRLELPRCRSCGRTFFPPQPYCPHCGSPEWERSAASGRGRIYSWVVCYTPFDPLFAAEVPYAILAVELQEGVRLFGRYRGDPAGIAADLPVKAIIYHVGDVALLGWEAA